MKKKIVLILAAMMSVCLLSACGNTDSASAPASSQPQSTAAEVAEPQTPEEAETVSDGSIPALDEIQEIPAAYLQESSQPGTIERVEYQTASYTDPDETQDKYAYIYVPYGYGETRQYDVLYLLHGGGGSAETCFGGEGQSSELKRILDNLIANGEMEPLLVVTPTFYPMDNADNSVSTAGEMVARFPDELANDLIPAVESQYSTYAETTDPQGLTASRGHRAFGGFSMGAVTTWYVFMENLDYFHTFIPISGDCWTIATQGGGSQPEETARALEQALEDSGYGPEDFFIYAITGSEDIAYPMMSSQIEAMQDLPDSFHFGTENGVENIRFAVLDGGVHSYDYVRRYLYNLMPLLWHPRI